MANNIKGITIEIDGNTQPLSNALSDLTKKSKEVDKELRNVNQALKLDPGNAEQVARKLELLEEKAELAQQKVERLKEAQKQMDANGVDKASKEYQTLTTEIVKAEGEFRTISQTAKDAQAEFEHVTESSKLLNTYLEATGKSVDDLKNIEGISRLVSDFEAGTLGAAGFDKVLKAVTADATGSAKNLEQVKAVLASIDSGNSLEGIKQDLEAIGNVNVSGLGAEFDQLSAKSQSLDAELKTINESLKMDPSSIDIVAQKQEVLTQNISATEGQLQILKTRYNELSSQGLDLGDEKFRNVQLEITNLENKLTGYKSNLSDLENAQQRLNTYFEATGTSVRDFSNVLGSELVQKIERGEASSQELANALDKIGASATQNKGDIDKFKATLDSVDSGVSFDHIKSELNSLGSEATETGTEFDGLKEQLSSIGDAVESSALADASDALGELSDKAGELAEGWLESSSEIQDAQNKVQISLGESKEKAQELVDHARNVVYNGYAESTEQATEAVIGLTQQLDNVNGDNIEDLSEKALTLATNWDQDLNEVIRAANTLTRTWGMSNEDAFDYLTAGFQSNLDYSGEFLDNLTEYAPLFKDSGYAADEYFNTLKVGEEAAIRNNDLMNDLIKEFGIRVSDGTVESAVHDLGGAFESTFQTLKDGGASNEEIFKALVAQVNSLGSEQEKATAISAIFGSQGEDSAQQVFDSLEQIPDAFGDVTGAADEARDNNNNSVTAMQGKWKEFQDSFAPLGEKLAEIATKILNALEPIISGLSDALANMDPTIATFIAAFVGISAVVGPVAAAIGGLIAILGGPVTAGIAAVVAAVAAVIAIFTNWDTIVQQVSTAWNGFCSQLSEEWSAMGDSIKGAWDSVTGWLGSAFSSIGDTIGGAWNSTIQSLGDSWNTRWGEIQSGWESIKGWFGGIFSGLNLQETWNTTIQSLGDSWNTRWSELQAGWDSISGWFSTIFANLNLGETWNTVTSSLSDSWNTRWSEIQTGWDSITGWFSTIFAGLNLGEMWNSVTSGITEAWNTLWTGVQAFWQTIAEWFMGIFSGLNIGELWNSAISGIQTAWDTIWGNIQAGWNTITGWIGDAFNGVKGIITGTWDESKQQTQTNWNAMGDIVKVSAQGMNQDSASQLLSLGDSLMSTFQEAEKNTDMSWEDIEKSVTQASQGMNDDVKQKLPEMLSQMKTVWDEGHQETDSKWGQIRDSVTSKAQEIRDNLSGKWNEVVSNFSQTWGDLKGKASEIWENVKRTVQDAIDRIKGMMNFNWHLPQIKLPHFNISGSFSLDPPSVPSISIDWYKKGGILTAPTIFGANGNTLLGGGEAGKEAVAPIDTLTGYVEDAVNKSNSEVQQELSEIKNLLSTFCNAALNKEFNLNIDGRSVASAIAPQVDRELGMLQQRKRRQ